MQTVKGEYAIIADIDGFLVNSEARLKKYVNLEAKARGDWAAFFESLDLYNTTTEGDELIPEGIALLEAERRKHPDAVVFYVTARNMTGRIPTLNYLRAHIDPDMHEDQLMQRPSAKTLEERVQRDVVEFKRSCLNKIRELGFMVIHAFDDHPEVHEMYEAEGVPSVLFYLEHIDCHTATGDSRLREKQIAMVK